MLRAVSSMQLGRGKPHSVANAEIQFLLNASTWHMCKRLFTPLYESQPRALQMWERADILSGPKSLGGSELVVPGVPM